MTYQRATLTMIIHGESGAGKSQLGDTVPGPRLILDAEGGSEFTPSWPKVIWNPNRYAPPGVQGCEPGQEAVPATTRVLVRDWATMARVFQWIESGQHYFLSVVLDSLTEIQKRCRDDIRGTEAMQMQNWGQLLIEMETAVRRLRDLTLDPSNHLRNVIILAMTDERKGMFRPYVQGALATTLPQFFHVIGYLSAQAAADGTHVQRQLLIQPWGQYLAKDRTDILTQTFGSVVLIRDIHSPELGGYTLEDMVRVLESRYATAVN
jgi:hypothetical protein